MDEEDIAFQEKQKAGMLFLPSHFPLLPRLASLWQLQGKCCSEADGELFISAAKANKEMAEKAKGKGPMNAGSQGIKKSGKK